MDPIKITVPVILDGVPVKLADIERAFAQWDADYRKDPKTFASKAQLDGANSEQYGQWAASTLLKYLIKP
jgi:hypothetical protein